MSVRVSYDAQIFRRERRGGISRYFTELVGTYHREPSLGVIPSLPARLVASKHLAEAGLGPRVVVPRALGRASQLLPVSQSPGRGADLVHHTYYSPFVLRGDRRLPRVSTIHDMIPELMPEYFPRGNPHWAKRQHVEQSSGLVFVSEASRRDLLRLYGPQDVPMVVAPLAPGSTFHPRSLAGTPAPPFVVFVGARKGYKDFDTLLLALARLRAPGLSVVAVGGGSLSRAERARVEELGLAGRVRQVCVSDEGLAHLYASAIALVVPSRYEGFGLPVVEAMATGCPVVASDIEVFREIADQAAEYFAVGDADALVVTLERVLGDDALRRSLREAGLLRVRDFTWSRTARITAELYREVLLGSRSWC
ncbi:MAG TPA: glycosyltransferase family 1 protein [Actinomycetes bacterium]